MKLLFLLFLVACTHGIETQNISANNHDPNITNYTTKNLTQLINTSTNESAKVDIDTQANQSIYLLNINTQADMCHIQVFNKSYWIDEGETLRLPKVTIHVFDAQKLHTQEKGMCEVLIAGKYMLLD